MLFQLPPGGALQVRHASSLPLDGTPTVLSFDAMLYTLSPLSPMSNGFTFLIETAWINRCEKK